MKGDQKLLLIAGVVVFVFSAIYVSMSGVPGTKTAGFLFPLSILGLFFGAGFFLWGLVWAIKDRK